MSIFPRSYAKGKLLFVVAFYSRPWEDSILWRGEPFWQARRISILQSPPRRCPSTRPARGEARVWRGCLINLIRPAPLQICARAYACPGDPGQSGRWICHRFQPLKTRLGASEFKLPAIQLLGGGGMELSIGEGKMEHYRRHFASSKG